MTNRVEWGISAGTHDASITVMRGDEIIFASHSERYSRLKNDKDLDDSLITSALKWGKPSIVYWYENPLLKWTRKKWAKQPRAWLSPKKYLKQYGITAPIKWGNHHRSHMAAGYYTRPFGDCATLVIDAIGEWTTTSIWNNEHLVWSDSYPKSFGLFYSAFTSRIGLKPNEDEYILMGMAAYGNPNRFHSEVLDVWYSDVNLHKGVSWWMPELTEQDYFDVAAAVQAVYESEFKMMLQKVKRITNQNKLVFMGGCALNCLANRLISDYFKDHWIMPNPGDAGSSLGAILAHKKKVVPFTVYTGHTIYGKYPVVNLLKELKETGIAGVAHGKAEFGPRALGNRSLLADPRGKEMQDKVNKIKQRQEFRPFAPIVKQENASRCFDVDTSFHSPYMQHVVKCKDPDKYPAIVHKDGTSRVQTVTKKSHRGLYDLLTRWERDTGCPLLLNTSLNIKGMPIVNSRQDAIDFETEYDVRVF